MSFSGFPSFVVTVEETSSSRTLTMSSQSSVSARGATLTFDASYPAGQTVDGQWVIDSSAGPITITGDSPASETIGSGVANGMMQDGYTDAGQGFDEYIRSRGNSWDSSRNVAPSFAGPLVIPQNARTIVHKSLRRDGASSGGDSVLDDAVSFIFMPRNETRENMFSPGATLFAAPSPDTHVFSEDDIDYSVLQNLVPPSGSPLLSTILSNLSDVSSGFGRMGDSFRPWNTTFDLVTSGYLGDLASYRSTLLYALHYNASNANKRDAVIRAIQYGLEWDAIYQNGQDGGTGAGQWHGYHNFMFFAAFLLKDSALLTRAQAMQSNMRDHPAYPPAWLVGNRVAHPTGSGQSFRFREPITDQDVGKPFWVEGFEGETRGSNVVSRYLTLSLPIAMQEIMPILLLQNGPNGETGRDAFLDGPADPSNDRYAALQVYDRITTWKNSERSYQTFSPYAFSFEAHIDAWSGDVPGWGWTGTPDAMEAYEEADQNFVAALNGGFSWTLTGYDFGGNQAITDRHVRWSTDQRTWIESSGHGPLGSITGIPRGVDIFVQIALENASGMGKWSPNYPYADTGGNFAIGNRNVVQPTGSEADSAPASVVAPKIAYRKFPDWAGVSWEDAPATLALASMIELSAGVGHWSGYPAPTYAFQWRRNGSPISGATSQDYTLTAADLGTSIDCVVTAINGSGSAVETTAAVAVPTLSTQPSGTIIDTEFDGEFLLRHATEYANAELTTSVAEVRYGFRTAEAATRGLLDIAPSGGTRPTFEMDLPQTLQGGTTYRIEAQFQNRANQGSSTGISFQLRRQSDNGELFIQTNNVDDVLWEIDATYTPSQNEDAAFRVRQNSGNGSASGPEVVRLKIAPV